MGCCRPADASARSTARRHAPTWPSRPAAPSSWQPSPYRLPRARRPSRCQRIRPGPGHRRTPDLADSRETTCLPWSWWRVSPSCCSACSLPVRSAATPKFCARCTSSARASTLTRPDSGAVSRAARVGELPGVSDNRRAACSRRRGVQLLRGRHGGVVAGNRRAIRPGPHPGEVPCAARVGERSRVPHRRRAAGERRRSAEPARRRCDLRVAGNRRALAAPTRSCGSTAGWTDPPALASGAGHRTR